MKPNFFNSLFKVIRKILAMDVTKDEQGVKPLGSKAKVSRYRLHEACALDPSGSPGEKEAAALMAYDRGDPTALDELVKQGWVVGNFRDFDRVWHEVNLRDAGWPGKRAVTANAGKIRAVAAIANAAPLSGGEWEVIAPYGEFPTADRKKVQKFGKAQADQMVATFNSVWHRMGTLFRGVPIFHGHPDVDPKSWPDDRRLGKIVELRAGANALEGRAEFNALGLENKTEGWWVYPSPAWLYPHTTANTIQPDELLSIGLVNTPNIPGSLPWANSETFEAIPAHETTESPTEETKEKDMKDKLAKMLGQDPATATEETLLSAITSIQSNAAGKAAAETAMNSAKTELETEKGKLTAANTALQTLRKDTAETLVGNAITAGVITEADRVATVNSLSAEGADIVVLGKALGAKPKVMNTGSIDLGGRKVAISNSRERTAAIQTEVNSRMKRDGLEYDAAYKSVQSDTQFAPLFAAMKQPGESAE